MRITRWLIGVIAATGVAVALVPPPAYAMDDLQCVRDETRAMNYRSPEGMGTIVVGYCAEYRWTPPPVGGTTKPPTDPPGDGGGGVGDVDPPSCDDIKEQLKNAAELLDLLTKEIDAAVDTARNAGYYQQNASNARELARRNWVDAQSRTAQLLSQYIDENDVPRVEVELNGRITYRAVTIRDVDTSLPYGQAAVDADHAASVLGREYDTKDDIWRGAQVDQDWANATLYDLQARMQALQEGIKALQGRSRTCK